MLELQARVRLPREVAAGEPFTIRVLASHPMVSGLGGADPLPRDVLARFVCRVEEASGAGGVVMDMRHGAGIAANPFFEFDAVVQETAQLRFEWHHEDGRVHVEEAEVTVTRG